MIKYLKSILYLLFIPLCLNAQSEETLPLAFPGADGFGKYTTGGRGGKVIAVTNLNDDGPGSFRQAVSTSGKRIVVFDISGTIHLKKPLTITHPHLTIAGQTAPGDGICIANAPVHLRANQVIVRFMRFRLGDLEGVNASSLTAVGYSDIIIDHCSFSWAMGENVKMYNNSNFTMQWCIISESLYKPKTNSKPQSYGALLGGMKASFHHNLFAHNVEYNPNFSGAVYHRSSKSKEMVDFRNNVIYNWGTLASSGGEGGNFNLVNNYYKPGKATKKDKNASILMVKNYGRFYLRGNFVYSNDSVSKDNWKGVEASDNVITHVRVDQEFPFLMTKTRSAENAYIDVLAKAGASLKRDDVDSRVIQSTGTGSAIHGNSFGKRSGIIDSQTSVDGWPVLKSDEKSKKSDWKEANIEDYLNDLVKDIIH